MQIVPQAMLDQTCVDRRTVAALTGGCDRVTGAFLKSQKSLVACRSLQIDDAKIQHCLAPKSSTSTTWEASESVQVPGLVDASKPYGEQERNTRRSLTARGPVLGQQLARLGVKHARLEF